jgi:hypothetical protein
VNARQSRLGIDFGTSNTVAVLTYPDGRISPLLFDGSPTLPSAVCLVDGSTLLVGRDAEHAARAHPERFEPNPKRRIDEQTVLLGEIELPVTNLISAVLGRVLREAERVAGGPITSVSLTHPAAWGHTRRGLLATAAQQAGAGSIQLVPEPVAAGHTFLATVGGSLPIGGSLVVYDLGAGTFDASVVRRTASGFDVLAVEGLAQTGGLDLDATIVGYLGAVFSARDPQLWARLNRPATTADRRANRLLWEDVRTAKEILSRTESTSIHVPLADEDAPLRRTQFEELARPLIDSTVTATRAAIGSARLGPADIFGIFLVGGASRIPMIATALQQAMGRPPVAVEQPELVVAQGSLLQPSTAAARRPGTAPGPVPGPAAAPQAAGPPSGYGTPLPVSSAPISSGPMSGAPMSGAPMSGAPMSGVPISGGPTSGAPMAGQHLPAGPVPPGSAPRRLPVGPPPPARSSPPAWLPLALIGLVLVVIVGAGVVLWTQLRKDTGNTGGGSSGNGEAAATPSQTAEEVTWATDALAYGTKRDETILYNCPAEGSPSPVWGTDLYTADSSVCTAAVHAGKLTLAEGGAVIIVIREGASSYEGSQRNDISTGSWDSYPASFSFAG